jgi:site-specific DNA-methyltransferase (adenine-specific)
MKIEEMINKIFLETSGNFEYLKQMPDNSIDLIIIDPPYLTTKENWDKKEVVTEWLSKELFRIAKDSCSLYVWCGIGEKSQSLIRWFPIFNKDWYFKDLITWKKDRGIGMRKGWLYTREEIMWFVKDNKKFIWNKEEQYLVGKQRIRDKNGIKPNQQGQMPISIYPRISNVWDDISESTFNLTDISSLHYTPKPIAAIERIIRVSTKENDIVLDCFIGSGSTALACKNLNRNFIGMEIYQEYIDITYKRLRGEL